MVATHNNPGGKTMTTTTHAPGEVRQAVRERYGKVAEESTPCCGPSCCGGTDAVKSEDISKAIGYGAQDLASIPADANLGLGCGNPTAIAGLRAGQTVLDLGSGAGIDCFLASERVGASGRVIGVDMTPQMVERARRNAAEGGFTNVEFRLGEIEALPVADASVDVIISNCVLNLSEAKERALAEAYRVLKPGGRVVVSDMVSDHPVPAVLEGNLDAVAACLPTYRERYLSQFRAAGFGDVRITSERQYPSSYILSHPSVQAFLAAHPSERRDLEAFAGSIFGAHFEATKA
jgi:arsenite methyltransferase